MLSKFLNIENKWKNIGTGGKYRTPTATKMRPFIVIVNGYPLTIVTNTCILDVWWWEDVLDMALMSSF